MAKTGSPCAVAVAIGSRGESFDEHPIHVCAAVVIARLDAESIGPLAHDGEHINKPLLETGIACEEYDVWRFYRFVKQNARIATVGEGRCSSCYDGHQ